MKYILILILMTSRGPELAVGEEFNTMAECVESRKELVQFMGRPIVNYQAVCMIKKDKR